MDLIILVVADTNSSNAKTNLFGQSRTSDLPKPKSESSVIGSTTVSSSSDTKGGMFGAGATEFSFSSIVKESETSSGGVFGGGGAFSFSDLAKQADSSTSPGFKVQGKISISNLRQPQVGIRWRRCKQIASFCDRFL